MKKQLLSLAILLLTTITISAQSYQYGLVQDFNNTGEIYEYTFVVVPDFANGAVSVGSVNITISISTGNTLSNFTQINGTNWASNTNFTAMVLNGFTAGDGTRDLWTFSREASVALGIASHTAGQQIPLFSFVVANMPTTGDITLTENTDAIIVDLAANSGGSFDLSNFFGADIDGVPITDTNFYGANAAGLITYDLMDPLLNVGEVDDTLGNIKISPNPVVTSFTIQGATSQIDEVKIFDINGGLVKEIATDVINEAISVKDLSAGVYFVQLSSQGAVSAVKLVKQ
ncbi:T9SS type A sorting domain-containing protein [uncultured Aquimarina sp.]|uniref:T9SS type A sorting domain-containing protein n=1 Tax=uncultured Aquimarina sp. TaxID=575652 RepID=UPI0026206BF5|nr:T9SS type A sorting domain-containing protein [uncultured Aquimarina sp.]